MYDSASSDDETASFEEVQHAEIACLDEKDIYNPSASHTGHRQSWYWSALASSWAMVKRRVAAPETGQQSKPGQQES